MNQPIYTGSQSKQAPLELTLIDGQKEFTKLLLEQELTSHPVIGMLY